MRYLFEYLSQNPFVFLFLSLALGYTLGKVSVKGITLGATAGTLVVGVILALSAYSFYGLSIIISSLVSDIFLMMFMYAIGMKVGPQFFSGLARGGLDFIVIGLIVVFANFAIVMLGVKLLDMAPGYAAGIISGSYTVTAVMGVAQSAITSGAYQVPDGLSADQVGANIAAGYAISYILSSIFIILLIKYLPRMFGVDPVNAAKQAEKDFSVGDNNEPLPTTEGFSSTASLPTDIRAYQVKSENIAGKNIKELFELYPELAILKVLKKDKVLDASSNPVIDMDDVIGVAGEYKTFIKEAQDDIGIEVDEPRVRLLDIEVADIQVGSSEHVGNTIKQLHKNLGFGIYFKALFRQGHQMPLKPQVAIETGDVIRVAGSKLCVNRFAKSIGSTAIVESTVTETFYLAVSLLIGYICGHFSIKIANIPFALGTSAGCMLTGIIFSYLRTRKPSFGGGMSEGARSFLQDIGLNLFVAVLAANVGPKILASFQGTVVVKIAVLGLIAALVPPLLAWLYGFYVRKMNPVILAGACAGARNSTPAMRAAQEISQSDMSAIGYPVPYALTSVIVLILGYISMMLS